MKTLKTPLLAVAVLLFAINSFSQLPEWEENMIDDNANFYEIRDAVYSTLEGDPEAKTSSGMGSKKFARWEWFWKDRVGKNQEGKTGSFNYAGEALMDFINNPVCTAPEGVSSNWSCLGPFTQPQLSSGATNQQNMGIIVSLYVDPNDHEIIFAGSNSGGLWQTENGLDPNPLWENKDQSRLPAMGVQSIVVYPRLGLFIKRCSGVLWIA